MLIRLATLVTLLLTLTALISSTLAYRRGVTEGIESALTRDLGLLIPSDPSVAQPAPIPGRAYNLTVSTRMVNFPHPVTVTIR